MSKWEGVRLEPLPKAVNFICGKDSIFQIACVIRGQPYRRICINEILRDGPLEHRSNCLPALFCLSDNALVRRCVQQPSNVPSTNLIRETEQDRSQRSLQPPLNFWRRS